MSKSKLYFLAIFYCSLVGTISIFLGQDLNWDLQNYHYYNPYQLLENRFDFDVMPAQIQSFFTPTLDIPFFIAHHWLNMPPVVIGFILGFIQGLNLFFLHLIALIVFPKKPIYHFYSFLAVLSALGGAIFFSEIGTIFLDNITSIFIIAALYLVIKSISTNSINKNSLLCIGLILGVGVGFKYTNIIHFVAILLTINLFLKVERVKSNLFLVISFSTGFLLTAGYWLIFLWLKFDNPVLPLFNDLFQSKYLEQARFADLRFIPKTITQYLFYPFYFIQKQNLPWEMPFRDLRLALGMMSALIVLVILLSKIINKITAPRGLQFLSLYFLIGYLIWINLFCYYRYILVFELISPVLLIGLISLIRIPKLVNGLLIVSILAFTIYWAQVPSWGRGKWTKDLFGINQQKLEQYQDSIIVFWSTQPTSYIIPFFPKSTQFVRIKSNLFQTPDSLLYQRATGILSEEGRSKYILIPNSLSEQEHLWMRQELLQISFIIDKESCELLTTKVQKYQVCKLSISY